MSKALRYLALMLIALLLLPLGMGAGIMLQAEHDANVYSQILKQSQNIAVVNQDLGIIYNGEDMSFAANIIDTLDKEYVLTSRGSAQAGLQNGSYAAIVSFPADFSEKVTQINEVKPQSAMITYQISPDLSQKAAIETVLRVMSLENHIDKSIGFMYASSILGELHDAQDTTTQLLTNDADGLHSVRNFATSQMIPRLEISALERTIPRIDVPDFSEFTSENEAVMDDLQKIYDKYTSEMDDDYKEIESKVVSAAQTTESDMDNAISGVSILVSESRNNVTYIDYVEMMQEDAEIALTERFGDTNLTIEESQNKIATFLGGTGTDSLVLEAVSQEYMDNIRQDIEEILLNLASPSDIASNTDVSEELQDIMELCELLIKEQKDMNMLYTNQYISNLTASMTDVVSESFSDIDTAIGAHEAAETLYIADSADTIRKYLQAREDAIRSRLDNEADAINQVLREMNNEVLSFDPTSYFNENQDEIDKIGSRFYQNNRDLNLQVTDAIRSRNELITDIFLNYEQYVETLKTDMNTTTQQATELLDSHLQTLLVKQINTSEDNRGLIEAFSIKLPNTRIGSVQNTDFYSFMLSPAESIEIGDGSKIAFNPPTQKKITDIINVIEAALWGLGGSAAIVGSIYLLLRFGKSRANGKS